MPDEFKLTLIKNDGVAEQFQLIKTLWLDPARWGGCPLCGKEVIKGNRANGCSGWAGGCPFVLEAECKGVTLTPGQVQALLQLRVLPKPVRIENEPRILILSTQGLIMDLRLPSAANSRLPTSDYKSAGAVVRRGTHNT